MNSWINHTLKQSNNFQTKQIRLLSLKCVFQGFEAGFGNESPVNPQKNLKHFSKMRRDFLYKLFKLKGTKRMFSKMQKVFEIFC